MKTLFNIALLLLFLVSGTADGYEIRPAITPEMVEADWERQREVRRIAAEITPAADAAGGCDGIINGEWGFHTDFEESPWWQVDLGKETPLGRIHIYNRCHGGFEGRVARLQVLVSKDGEAYREVYRHNGVPFLGYTDNLPLEVVLTGTVARYVRIQLPDKQYLHLDEVMIFDGTDENVALGKPALQSSISQWSTGISHHEDGFMSLEALMRRGQALLDNLEGLGLTLQKEINDLKAVLARAEHAARESSETKVQTVTRDLLWAMRRLALQNPLLDFDEILFVKRAPTLFPHVSDQYYGWFARGGGGIYILSGFKAENPTLRCVTASWPEGNFLRPELSYCATKVLFAYCRYYPHVAEVKDKTVRDSMPEDSFYHLYEMNLDGTGIRQLTHGYYNDFDGRYLPNGEIVFLSTRKGVALQADRDSARATVDAIQPESYVRCGGDAHRPVPVFTLHRMNGQGGDLRAISAFENFEWTPAIHHDGQVLYARWDYIDRFNGDYMSLWSTRADGTNAQLVYGNFTSRPQCVFEARPVPDSQKLVFTATAHHSITGGALVLLDRTRGTEYEEPLERLTPEVCFPETECWPNSYYAGPWPLSEDHFLVSWSDRPLPAHVYTRAEDERNPTNASGIYLYDRFGNLNLLYRDSLISSETPLPVKPRPRPFQTVDSVDWDAPKQGAYLVQDVYEGMGDLPRGTIARLRIVGVLPKVQPFMNQPVLGVSAEDTGKVILGTVPVEKDGSAYFMAPSGMPVFFQALDHENMAVRTMRSLTYVQAGQTLSCIGCHEHRDGAPALNQAVFAARRPPSGIEPEAEGTWPLRYDVLVQPVLDAACVQCHQPGYADARAAAINLTAETSYQTLLDYADKDLRTLAFEKPHSEVGDCVARQSKLLALLIAPEGHEGVFLEKDSLDRLKVWMDTYAHLQGAFSGEQEGQLLGLREQVSWVGRQ